MSTRQTAAAWFGKLARAAKASREADAEDIKKLHDTVLSITAGLEPVGARVLGLHEHGGVVYSEPSVVLHWLVGGRQERVPLTQGPIWSAIYQDRRPAARRCRRWRSTSARSCGWRAGSRAWRAAIAQALKALAVVPRQERDFGGLRTHLDTTDAAGVSARLQRWQAADLARASAHYG